MLIPDDIKTIILEALESRKFAVQLRADFWAEDCIEQVAAIDAALAWLSAQEQGVTAEMQPDWSDAPDWAGWWAVNPTGRAYWHELRPYLGEHVWHKVRGSKSEEAARAVANWRTTLQQRRPGGA